MADGLQGDGAGQALTDLREADLPRGREHIRTNGAAGKEYGQDDFRFIAEEAIATKISEAQHSASTWDRIIGETENLIHGAYRNKLLLGAASLENIIDETTKMAMELLSGPAPELAGAMNWLWEMAVKGDPDEAYKTPTFDDNGNKIGERTLKARETFTSALMEAAKPFTDILDDDAKKGFDENLKQYAHQIERQIDERADNQGYNVSAGARAQVGKDLGNLIGKSLNDYKDRLQSDGTVKNVTLITQDRSRSEPYTVRLADADKTDMGLMLNSILRGATKSSLYEFKLPSQQQSTAQETSAEKETKIIFDNPDGIPTTPNSTSTDKSTPKSGTPTTSDASSAEYSRFTGRAQTQNVAPSSSPSSTIAPAEYSSFIGRDRAQNVSQSPSPVPSVEDGLDKSRGKDPETVGTLFKLAGITPDEFLSIFEDAQSVDIDRNGITITSTEDESGETKKSSLEEFLREQFQKDEQLYQENMLRIAEILTPSRRDQMARNAAKTDFAAELEPLRAQQHEQVTQTLELLLDNKDKLGISDERIEQLETLSNILGPSKKKLSAAAATSVSESPEPSTDTPPPKDLKDIADSNNNNNESDGTSGATDSKNDNIVYSTGNNATTLGDSTDESLKAALYALASATATRKTFAESQEKIDDAKKTLSSVSNDELPTLSSLEKKEDLNQALLDAQEQPGHDAAIEVAQEKLTELRDDINNAKESSEANISANLTNAIDTIETSLNNAQETLEHEKIAAENAPIDSSSPEETTISPEETTIDSGDNFPPQISNIGDTHGTFSRAGEYIMESEGDTLSVSPLAAEKEDNFVVNTAKTEIEFVDTIDADGTLVRSVKGDENNQLKVSHTLEDGFTLDISAFDPSHLNEQGEYATSVGTLNGRIDLIIDNEGITITDIQGKMNDDFSVVNDGKTYSLDELQALNANRSDDAQEHSTTTTSTETQASDKDNTETPAEEIKTADKKLNTADSQEQETSEITDTKTHPQKNNIDTAARTTDAPDALTTSEDIDATKKSEINPDTQKQSTTQPTTQPNNTAESIETTSEETTSPEENNIAAETTQDKLNTQESATPPTKENVQKTTESINTTAETDNASNTPAAAVEERIPVDNQFFSTETQEGQPEENTDDISINVASPDDATPVSESTLKEAFPEIESVNKTDLYTTITTRNEAGEEIEQPLNDYLAETREADPSNFQQSMEVMKFLNEEEEKTATQPNTHEASTQEAAQDHNVNQEDVSSKTIPTLSFDTDAETTEELIKNATETLDTIANHPDTDTKDMILASGAATQLLTASANSEDQAEVISTAAGRITELRESFQNTIDPEDSQAIQSLATLEEVEHTMHDLASSLSESEQQLDNTTEAEKNSDLAEEQPTPPNQATEQEEPQENTTIATAGDAEKSDSNVIATEEALRDIVNEAKEQAPVPTTLEESEALTKTEDPSITEDLAEEQSVSSRLTAEQEEPQENTTIATAGDNEIGDSNVIATEEALRDIVSEAKKQTRQPIDFDDSEFILEEIDEIAPHLIEALLDESKSPEERQDIQQQIIDAYYDANPLDKIQEIIPDPSIEEKGDDRKSLNEKLKDILDQENVELDFDKDNDDTPDFGENRDNNRGKAR